jgi:hypothetical protein
VRAAPSSRLARQTSSTPLSTNHKAFVRPPRCSRLRSGSYQGRASALPLTSAPATGFSRCGCVFRVIPSVRCTAHPSQSHRGVTSILDPTASFTQTVAGRITRTCVRRGPRFAPSLGANLEKSECRFYLCFLDLTCIGNRIKILRRFALDLLYFQDPLGGEGVSLTVNLKLYWRHVRRGTRYSALGL